MSVLSGRRVVVTRAPHQAEELADLLRQRGAEPLLYPCIDIAPPEDTASLDQALSAADGDYDWLVLTSTNTVAALARRMETLGLPTDALSSLKVAAVGTATEQATEQRLGLRVTLVPETHLGSALTQALAAEAGARVLLSQSALADASIADALAAAGLSVTVVTAYRTVIGSGGVDLPGLLRVRQVDAITFTSPSTVANSLERLSREGGDAALLQDVCLACIGTTTAAAARAAGLNVSVVPESHTLQALIDALERHFALVKAE